MTYSGISSQYSGAKKFDFYQKSNFWVAPPRFIEKIPTAHIKRRIIIIL